MSGEIPSQYLIDKASKRRNEEILAENKQSIINKLEIEKALAEGLSRPEDRGDLPVVPLEKQTIQEATEAQLDPTLTELEKTLSEKQLKFAWNLAKARATGKVNLRQCALDAGYSEANSGNVGSELSRNPVICRVVADRLPIELKLKAVKERGPDYVIEKAVTILERALQEKPVLDKHGNPTGYYIYDGALAKSTLDSLANWMGMTKQKVEVGGSADGEPIKVDSRVVAAQVIGIKERLASLRSVKAIEKKKEEDKDDYES
jgi:hypothetical protein